MSALWLPCQLSNPCPRGQPESDDGGLIVSATHSPIKALCAALFRLVSQFATQHSMAHFPRTLSRRASLPYAPPVNNYSYQDRGLEYADQGYSPYLDDGYGGGMYQDQMAMDTPYGQHYGQPSYSMHGQQAPVYQNSRYGHSYDDLALGRVDPYYAEDNNMQLQVARPLTPLTPLQAGYSTHSLYRPRQRRHSTVSYSALPPAYIDTSYRPTSSLHIKFKRKNALMAGISLEDAQSTRTKLSGNDLYTMDDLHANHYRRIRLRVQWSGYNPLTYEVPLDDYHRDHHHHHRDRRSIDMQSLCRRVSRACVHYLETYHVPVHQARVQLHHLEEVAYGVWQPMLSTR
ncbi:hypothetical protein C8F01DRAFT_82690 [Mycena amicta]|nr:hypothetical protein C8F01DRAFT_82690 [Mycena amicta]